MAAAEVRRRHRPQAALSRSRYRRRWTCRGPRPEDLTQTSCALVQSWRCYRKSAYWVLCTGAAQSRGKHTQRAHRQGCLPLWSANDADLRAVGQVLGLPVDVGEHGVMEGEVRRRDVIPDILAAQEAWHLEPVTLPFRKFR